ncbi:hypothetical protein DFH06DRAFT_1476198 [Mycena polygramma]|nr:hypothetical protein DFH06DRAFT_1476198 [Mycena polygramma]
MSTYLDLVASHPQLAPEFVRVLSNSLSASEGRVKQLQFHLQQQGATANMYEHRLWELRQENQRLANAQVKREGQAYGSGTAEPFIKATGRWCFVDDQHGRRSVPLNTFAQAAFPNKYNEIVKENASQKAVIFQKEQRITELEAQHTATVQELSEKLSKAEALAIQSESIRQTVVSTECGPGYKLDRVRSVFHPAPAPTTQESRAPQEDLWNFNPELEQEVLKLKAANAELEAANLKLEAHHKRTLKALCAQKAKDAEKMNALQEEVAKLQAVKQEFAENAAKYKEICTRYENEQFKNIALEKEILDNAAKHKQSLMAMAEHSARGPRECSNFEQSLKDQTRELVEMRTRYEHEHFRNIALETEIRDNAAKHEEALQECMAMAAHSACEKCRILEQRLKDQASELSEICIRYENEQFKNIGLETEILDKDMKYTASLQEYKAMAKVPDTLPKEYTQKVFLQQADENTTRFLKLSEEHKAANEKFAQLEEQYRAKLRQYKAKCRDYALVDATDPELLQARFVGV